LRGGISEKTEEILSSLKERSSLLLHSCCAPCSAYVLGYLAGHFDLTVFFYNPNIMPREEYLKRLFWQKELLSRLDIQSIQIIEPDCDGDVFLAAAEGFENEPEGGARCEKCFELRLRETAAAARALGFPWFCTTLTVSPHKNAARINALGQAFQEEYGVRFLPCDFKKHGGYQRSVELSKKFGLYRQNYCGCLFSKTVVE
jgi:predicted adenine nucleotide alpha hydrolase (AANH) superfamily ATPase